MTEYGKWLIAGCVLLILGLSVIALWSVFFWLSLVLMCLGLVVLGFRVYGLVHLGITQVQMRNAIVAKARAEADQQRAIADQQRAQAAALWSQTKMIPQTAIGLLLDTPEQRDLVHVWTYKQEVSPAVIKLEEQEAEVVEALLPALPGPTDLLPLLTTFRPDPMRILLALNAGGMVTCSLEGVSHVALAAPTGGGKSSIMRLLLAQMLFCGAHIWLADPHYTPLDPRTGEDWRMIEARLAQKPFTKASHIAYLLSELVGEMRRRYELRGKGRPFGDPCYLAIDEWPAILSDLGKDAKEAIADTTILLRQARKVSIYVITSSQDFLVETIGTSGEVRANLRTAYFAGGGIGTARALLDQKIKLPEDVSLGKGLVLLRSEEALPVPALVRVPYASNDALYRLLPAARQQAVSSAPVKVEPELAEPTEPDERPGSGSSAAAHLRVIGGKKSYLDQRDRNFIRMRRRAGVDRKSLVKELREMRGSFSNEAYTEFQAVCDAVDAEEEGNASDV